MSEQNNNVSENNDSGDTLSSHALSSHGRSSHGRSSHGRSDEEPILSIVVGTYNRLEKIQACIDSVCAETRIPFRLYVTDAGSTDGTQQYLESIEDPRIEIIFEGKLSGQAKAYNAIFEQVTSKYVCWISDDNVIVNAGFDKAVGVMNNQPRIGMLGLKVKDVVGPFVKAPYIGGISEAGILNVNQGVLPTKLLQQVGGFSETFRNYGIDPDLTAKILLSGYDVAYTKDIAIHHQRDWAEDPNSEEGKELAQKHARSKVLYLEKYAKWIGTPLSVKLKTRAYQYLQKKVSALHSVNSTDTFAGAIARDWYNACHASYIGFLDPWVNRSRPFHLRQRIPAWSRPKQLPSDADLKSVS
ncbi:MAG: glycosyltransferase [Pseudomonadota bacterium]